MAQGLRVHIACSCRGHGSSSHNPHWRDYNFLLLQLSGIQDSWIHTETQTVKRSKELQNKLIIQAKLCMEINKLNQLIYKNE